MENGRNFLFKHSENLIKSGEIDLIHDDIAAVLLGWQDKNCASYSEFDYLRKCEYLSNINSEHIVSEPIILSNKVFDEGVVFDADDITFPLFTPPKATHGVLIYKRTDHSKQSHLISFIGYSSGMLDRNVFPIEAIGGDIIVTWDNGKNKIFRLRKDVMECVVNGS